MFMRDSISIIVHLAAWLAAILTVLATLVCAAIIADGNYCWSAFAFTMVTLPLGGGTLLLGVIPSSVLYFKNGQRRDLKSLWLTGISLAILFGEAILLNIMPMRGE
jgi:hypothetical protein